MELRRRFRPQVLWLERNGGSGLCYYPGPVAERRAHVLELVGDWEAAEHIWRQGLEHARGKGAPGDIARTLLQLSKLLQRRGRYGEAMAQFEEAREISLAANNRELYGQALSGLGVVLWRQGDCDRAAAFYEQALGIFTEIGFSEGMSTIYNNMGIIHEGRGEYAKAVACYQSKRTIDEAAGNKRGIGTVLNNLGVCLLHQGEMARAQEMFQEKLQLEQDMGNKAGVATALSNLGIVFRNRMEYGRANECCLRTIEIYRELGDNRGLGLTTNNLGNIYKQQGRPREAMECYRSALAVAESQGDRKDIAIYSGNMAQIYHHWIRDPARALEGYDRAIGILREMNQPFHLCEHQLYRCHLLLDIGRMAGLAAEVQQARTTAEAAQRSDITFLAEVLEARLLALSDAPAAAGRLESLAQQTVDRHLRAEALYWLAVTSGQERHRTMALQALRAVSEMTGDPELTSRIRSLEGPAKGADAT